MAYDDYDSLTPPRTPSTQRDVSEYTVHVLKEIKRLNDTVERIRSDMTDIKVEIGILKVKSHVWGLIGGAIPVLIALAIWILKLLWPA
jgi:hypothetical protein